MIPLRAPSVPPSLPAPAAAPAPLEPRPARRSIADVLAAVRDPSRLSLGEVSARRHALAARRAAQLDGHARLVALVRGAPRRDLEALVATLRPAALRPERPRTSPLAFDYPRLRETLGVPLEDVPLVFDLLERLREADLLRPLPESPGPVEVCPACFRPWGEVFTERCPTCGRGCLRREVGFHHLASGCGKPVFVLDRGRACTTAPSSCPACHALAAPDAWRRTDELTRCLVCDGATVEPFAAGDAAIVRFPCPCGAPADAARILHVYTFEVGPTGDEGAEA